MNQKVMTISYRIPGEVNNGDVVQCPKCRKKFVVIPGLIQYKTGGGVDVWCSWCEQVTDAAYYEANPAELPARKRVKKDGVH